METAEVTTFDPDAVIPHYSIDSGERLFQVAAFILGVSAGLGRYFEESIGVPRLAIATATLFGVYGWWTGLRDPVLRRYLKFAVPFAAIGLISFFGTRAPTQFDLPFAAPFAEQGVKLLWFVLIAGIAATLQNPRLLRALFAGLITAGTIYLLAALQRAMGGLPALNKQDSLLTQHRNVVDTFLVGLVPIVLTAPFLKMRIGWRIAFVVGTVAWIISSSGRTGALALGLCPILLFVLRPPKSGASLVPRVLAGAAVAFLLFNVLSTQNISWLPAANRITQARGGVVNESDEIRELLLRKAFALTADHPFLGIGIGRFPGAYDPVVEEATTSNVRSEAIRLQAHNTYIETMASTGITGLFFFMGLILVPLIAALRFCKDRDVRAVTVSFCLVLFCISFHTMYDAIFFVPLAIILTMAVRAERAESEADFAAP